MESIMKSMKKIVVALVMIGTLSLAGAAMAKEMWGRGGPGWQPGTAPGMTFRHGAFQGGRLTAGKEPRMRAKAPHENPGPQRLHVSPDMPDDIRAKVVEAAKLRIDLEDVLSRNPLDRARAVELHGKIAKLDQEAAAWRFNKKLDRIEEARKRHELKRKARGEAPEKAASSLATSEDVRED